MNVNILDKDVQAGSALTSVLNHRESFLNGENATMNREIKVVGTQEEFDLPECLKNLSLQEILEKGKISDDELAKLKASHANDNLPLMPTDPTQMSEFIIRIHNFVSRELVLLKSTPLLSDEEYSMRMQNIQIQAAKQLLVEYMIGDDIRRMKCHKGVKSKGKSAGIVTKKDAIAAKYPRFGARRIRDFQKLFAENVWEAIKTAFERGEIPTRALALSYGINKKSRITTAKKTCDFKKWRAKEEDFEATIKNIAFCEEIKACSLFCNIGVGTSLLEKFTKIKIVVANEKDKREVERIEDYILTAIQLLAKLINRKFLNKLLRQTKNMAPNSC